jgi:hypothetical protein
MVNNQCLWASDLNTVNDPAELLHIRAEFERVIGYRLPGRLRRRCVGQESESTEYVAYLDRLSRLWPGETLYGDLTIVCVAIWVMSLALASAVYQIS